MKNLHLLNSQKVIHGLSITLMATVLLAACTSTAPPVAQMAVSRSAVSNASSAGAHEFAPILLKSAMDKMAAAELAMGKEDFLSARNLAEEAQVDAQLAAATAQSIKAQKSADAVQEDSRVLRKEIDRKSK